MTIIFFGLGILILIKFLKKGNQTRTRQLCSEALPRVAVATYQQEDSSRLLVHVHQPPFHKPGCTKGQRAAHVNVQVSAHQVWTRDYDFITDFIIQ